MIKVIDGNSVVNTANANNYDLLSKNANTVMYYIFYHSIGSDGEQPSEVMGKVRCKSDAVPQL